MSKRWLFYKGNVTEFLGDYLPKDLPVETYRYHKESIYPWMKVKPVRNKTCWAKVALRNVPKKYRALLLLLE